ncbi:MAG: hypothetical protein QM482_10015 [Sulfurospirillum sp.]
MLVDNLYRLEFKDENKAVVRLSDENHPVFRAHFPAKPIMPGFMHFEIVSEVFGFKINSVKRAKFLKLVKPNETLIYKRDGNRFQVFSNNDSVAIFTL